MIRPNSEPFFTTNAGAAFLGDSLELMSALPAASVNLIVTSPPYALYLKKGYRAKVRPSGHVITHKFTDRGGAIPPNVLIFGNNDATGTYMRRCKEANRPPHPARFPVQLPVFFIRFLTDPGDLVLDPFA